MLNVAFALNILFVEIYFLIFKQPGWLSLEIFIFIFCITYIILEFPFVRRHLQPTIGVHIIFGCSYAILITTFCLMFLALMGDANPFGVVMFFSTWLIIANVLLILGILLLLVESVYKPKFDDDIKD